MEWNRRVCLSVSRRSRRCSGSHSCSVFRREEGGEGALLLLLTKFIKQNTKAMQLRFYLPSPQTKTQPERAYQPNCWQLPTEASGAQGG